MKTILLDEYNYSVEDFLQIMATCKVSPPERMINWGKMLVPPKKGESFLSWLMQQAWAFGITPRRLILSEIEYWMENECISLSFSPELYWPLTLDVLPIPHAWEKVLQQRGLNIGIRELQLDISKWFYLTKEPEITKDRLRNYYHYNLRYCPECWRDENNRYFKIVWRLPFVIVCPEHGVELKESCSSCGELLFDDKRYHLSAVITLGNFREEWLLKCRHCNQSLLEEIVEEKYKLLAILQNKILNTLQSDSYLATQRGYLIFWHTYNNVVKSRKQNSAEMRLKLMDEILEKPILIPYPNFYSQELLLEIERRLQAVTLYLSGTSSKKLANKFGLSRFMIRAFSEDLLKRKPIDEIIKRQFKFRGKFGLEFAKGKILEFKSKHNRLPKSNDKEMRGIMAAIQNKEWVSFGIRTWNDLLKKVFGRVNAENRVYADEEGLKRAIIELHEFQIIHGRLPKVRDKKMGAIRGAITRQEWASFGIRTWNDLLIKAFGKINKEQILYIGKEGLDRAIAELHKFQTKQGRLPKANDKGMSVITMAITRQKWVSFGIRKWNDLLRKAFDKVNIRMGRYCDEQGLKRAIAELHEFQTEHSRLPKDDDKEMYGILSAIIRQEWVSFGIKKWNDLLRRAFDKVNNEYGVYCGKQGLDRAIAELREFQTKQGRLPKANDKEVGGIISALYRRTWTLFGIITWNDLLKKVFGKVNK